MRLYAKIFAIKTMKSILYYYKQSVLDFRLFFVIERNPNPLIKTIYNAMTLCGIFCADRLKITIFPTLS